MKIENINLFNKISKLLFQRKFGSLEYASPFILAELLESTRGEDSDELNGVPENRQLQHIARKVKILMDSQAKTLKSTRIGSYNKVQRWMPYSTPIYFPSLQIYFDQIKNCKKTLPKVVPFSNL